MRQVPMLMASAGLTLVSISGAAQPSPSTAKGSIEVSGTTLGFVRDGAGPPLVVIGSSVYYPRAFSPGLRDHFEMVFVDSRHFAADYSPSPHDLGRLTLKTFADDVEVMREGLGLDQIFVLGHSAHAQIALAYARMYPKHTRALVLVAGVPYDQAEFGATGEAFWEEHASADRKALLAKNRVGLEQRLEDADPNQGFSIRYRANGPLYWADPTFDSAPLLEGLRNTAALDALFRGIPGRDAVRETLEAIEVPILVIVGQLDFAIPHTVWEELVDGLDNVTYVLLEGESHNPQTESPEAFDPRLLEWFESSGL